MILRKENNRNAAREQITVQRAAGEAFDLRAECILFLAKLS